ncbi:MAG TPA: hypothetical protein VGC97_24500 [Pyrinomonadaceae bacterium]|jgi:hypothetical protein
MNQDKNSLIDLVERIQRTNPDLLRVYGAKSEDEFDSAFLPILEKAIIQLEKNKKNLASLKEEGLTAVFASCFIGIGLTVTQETNSNGHVDLTIVADHCTPIRTKLGEAKIFRGFKYHISGLTQLIGLYTTGREGSGLLIEYVKKDGIKGLIEKLRKRMDKELPLNQIDKSTAHIIKWSFLTAHKHSSGENLTVQHISCNLYYE